MLSIEKFDLLKMRFAEVYKMPLYLLSDERDMDILFEQVVGYFSE